MKKGFTLIELLAIIIILALISLVAFPSIIEMQRNSELQEKEATLKNLYIATESYILSDYKDKYDNSSFNIYVSELIEKGYVKSDSINPNTDSNYTEKDYVRVTRNENNEFVFELMYVEIITFTVINEIYDYSETFTALKEMKWEEWISSSYNTGGYEPIYGATITFELDGDNIYADDGMANIFGPVWLIQNDGYDESGNIIESNTMVLKDDIIIANRTYYVGY